MADGRGGSPAPAGAEAFARAGELIARARSAIQHVVRGKDHVVEQVLVSVIAEGHVLLEDVPGVGKTTLASSLAVALGGSFRRIQFTSDLLPADITGVNVLQGSTGEFAFRPGPVFANVVLADEINRATPKAQSALLEAMNERRVTVDGLSHPLPRPFIVVATQNPTDFHGTFPLPDSQFDRFLMRVGMGYPDRESERAILRSGGSRKVEPQAALSPEDVLSLVATAERVSVHAEVEDYLLGLVDRTRTDSRLARGASTRGAEELYRAARALALARGRSFVIPEDVRELAVPVLAHRVLCRSEAGPERAIEELLWDLPAPK